MTTHWPGHGTGQTDQGCGPKIRPNKGPTLKACHGIMTTHWPGHGTGQTDQGCGPKIRPNKGPTLKACHGIMTTHWPGHGTGQTDQGCGPKIRPNKAGGCKTPSATKAPTQKQMGLSLLNPLWTSKNVPRPWCFNAFDFRIALARRRGANFWRLQLPKVVRDCQFLTIVTSESLSRAGVVQILATSSSKSAPTPSVFNDFDYQIAVARRRGANFSDFNFQKVFRRLQF